MNHPSTVPYLSKIYAQLHLDPRRTFAAYQDACGPRLPGAKRVQVLIGASSGCAYWRVWNWAMMMARDPGYYIRCSTELRQDDVGWADVVWSQRFLVAEAGLAAKRGGKKLIFDIDDYVHDIPHYNCGYTHIRDEGHVEIVEQTMAVADLVTFSTRELARMYADRCPRSHVCRNAMVPEHGTVDGPLAKARGKFVIGWGGSTSHKGDLAIVGHVLTDILEEHPQACLVQLGAVGEHLPVIDRLPRERVAQLYWMKAPHRLSNYVSLCDVVLAPLADNAFNRCKSNVKYLETAIVGVPLIASDIEPYRDTLATLCRTSDDWRAAIADAIQRPRDLEVKGKISALDARERFGIDALLPEWRAAIDTVLQ